MFNFKSVVCCYLKKKMSAVLAGEGGGKGGVEGREKERLGGRGIRVEDGDGTQIWFMVSI